MSTLGVLLISGGHERAHYALMLATAASAMGRGVTLFATNEGCRLLLAEAPLADEGREAALAIEGREAALAAQGIATLQELLEAAEALGIRLLACEAGLRIAGLEAAALRPGVEASGLVTFLAATAGGQIVSL